jgi:hypothetical protein
MKMNMGALGFAAFFALATLYALFLRQAVGAAGILGSVTVLAVVAAMIIPA